MFRVLVVEDDLQLCRQLQLLLEQEYRVSTAHTLVDAETLLDEKRFDLVLLDRLVHDGDAIELLPYIRDCSPSTRIILMSNRNEVQERIKGLSEGADDYVPKPLMAQEVILRIRRLLQFERVPESNWLQAGAIRFNRATGETYSGKLLVHLRPREAAILSCLLRFKNRVVTRESIINHVWGTSEAPSNTTLDVYLRRLRIMLGEASSHIRTVRGFGYLIQDPAAVYK